MDQQVELSVPQQSRPVVQQESYKEITKSNSFKRIIFIVVCLVVLIGILGGSYYLGTKKNMPIVSNQTSKISSYTTPTKSVITSPTSNKIASWEPYTKGEIIPNAGFSIDYPTGWTVNLKKETNLYADYQAIFRLDFDFLPEGKQINPQSVDWMGWGEMNIDVYNFKKDINQFIQDYYPKYQQNITVSSTRQIGNKLAYYITAKDTSYYWAPRYVVLGKDYSYELGFGQNGERGFMEKIENEIYPTIYFK